jgi:molybdate transport system substrate-binding protein
MISSRMMLGAKVLAAALAALLVRPEGASAQMKVIISGGFSGAYEQLLPEVEQASGIKVTTGSGASQGDGPQTIGAQLARGEKADVVILSREGLDGLIAAKRIAAGTDVDLATVGIGLAVRAGAAKPDLGTVDAIKQALLKARAVAVPASTSGIWLVKELFPRLGIAQTINVKVSPRGAGATAMVAAGDAELGVLPVSEILHDKGVELAGVLPPEIQVHSDVFGRRRRRSERSAGRQAADRISHFRPRGRGDQEERPGAAREVAGLSRPLQRSRYPPSAQSGTACRGRS